MVNVKRRPRWFGRLAAAAVLAGGLGMLWQGDGIRADDPPAAIEVAPSITYIGTVEGGKIGVVATATDFIAYICGADDSFNGKCSRWFRGSVAAGKLTGESADGSKFEAAISGDAAAGSVTLKGGAKLAFNAPKANTEATLAGLYRAEEKDETSDVVAGWIIDEKDVIVGAAANKKNGQIATLQQGKGNNTGAIGANVATQKGTRGQPVNDPKNPAVGKQGKRFGPEIQKQKLDELQANVGNQGGSPIAGLVVQQVKRFQQTGGKAGSDLEKRTFAKLQKANGVGLADYVKNWEALPQAVRAAATGGVQVPVNKALTGADVAAAVKRGANVAKGAAKKAGTVAKAPQLARVRALEVLCVNKADLGKDEVFATFIATAGETSVEKTTAVYTGFRKGDRQPLKPGDNLPANGPFTQDVFLQAALFDDDSADKARVQQVLTSLVAVAAEVAKEVTEATGQGQKVAQTAANLVDDFNKAVETITAAFPDTVFLGGDVLLATTDKKVQNLNGTARDEFAFIRRNIAGGIKVDYRIRGLRAE